MYIEEIFKSSTKIRKMLQMKSQIIKISNLNQILTCPEEYKDIYISENLQ